MQYRNKETGQVVNRPGPWEGADNEPDIWERVGGEEQVSAPAGDPDPREPVDQDNVDEFEKAGGAPDEDLNPGEAPGEILAYDEQSREELNATAAAKGIDDPQDFPNIPSLIEAIEEVDAKIAAQDDGEDGGESVPALSDDELKGMTRPELNDAAAERGVEDAEELGNKGDVVKAIKKAQKG